MAKRPSTPSSDTALDARSSRWTRPHLSTGTSKRGHAAGRAARRIGRAAGGIDRDRALAAASGGSCAFLRTGDESAILGKPPRDRGASKDGREIKVELAVTALSPGRGPYGVQGFISDRTEKIAARSRSSGSCRRTPSADLTGGVAHDFNNMLTVIIGDDSACWKKASPTVLVSQAMAR